MSTIGNKDEAASLETAGGLDTSWLDELLKKLSPEECAYLCTKLQEDPAGEVAENSEDEDTESDVMIPIDGGDAEDDSEL